MDSLDAVDIALLYEDNWHPDRCGSLLCSSCIMQCISYVHSQDWPPAQGRHYLGFGHNNLKEALLCLGLQLLCVPCTVASARSHKLQSIESFCYDLQLGQH